MKFSLTDLQLAYRGKFVLPDGIHGFGDNIYLQVTSPTAASWLFKGMMAGKRREFGLGSFLGTGRTERLTLGQARREAENIREMIRRGDDPRAGKKKAAAVAPLFSAMLDSYLTGTWQGDDDTQLQWRQQLAKHCGPLLKTPVDRVTTDLIVQLLKPIWKRTLGGDQRRRIEKVMDHARVKLSKRGAILFAPGANPARWGGHLEHELGKATIKGKTNFAALPIAATPGFIASLDRAKQQSQAMTFAILTALRANEACEARWEEIDLDAAQWIIPAARMKKRKAHKVPLSRQAIELLQARKDNDSVFVFPALTNASKPMDSRLINEMIWRMGLKGQVTLHGFRATFRSWANQQTRGDGSKMYDHDDLEFCLAHVLDKTVAAYQRDDSFDRRRMIMQAWADFAFDITNIVQLPQAAKAVA